MSAAVKTNDLTCETQYLRTLLQYATTIPTTAPNEWETDGRKEKQRECRVIQTLSIAVAQELQNIVYTACFVIS